MLNEKMQAKHLLDLSHLERVLKEANIPCSLIRSGKTLPLSMLVVPMENDEKGRPRAFSCSYIPMDEEDLEFTALLQIYSELPFTVAPSRQNDLRTFLLACNLLQPVGHFGIREDREIYFRYVLVGLQHQPLDEELIIETLMMVEYAINSYQGLVEKVASGEIRLEDGLKELDG